MYSTRDNSVPILSSCRDRCSGRPFRHRSFITYNCVSRTAVLSFACWRRLQDCKNKQTKIYKDNNIDDSLPKRERRQRPTKLIPKLKRRSKIRRTKSEPDSSDVCVRQRNCGPPHWQHCRASPVFPPPSPRRPLRVTVAAAEGVRSRRFSAAARPSSDGTRSLESVVRLRGVSFIIIVRRRRTKLLCAQQLNNNIYSILLLFFRRFTGSQTNAVCDCVGQTVFSVLFDCK